MRHLMLVLAFALLSGCDLPHSTVKTGAPSPSLIVTGAPADSTLYVDGVPMGMASAFNGKPYTIAVLEGVHNVEVHEGTKVIYSEKVFVSSGETHSVNVTVGGAQ